jgi:predicted ATPase/class 3 adenylate cyclase
VPAGTITFLFTDLEGSTRLWEQFPEAMKGALKRHDAILRSAIEAAGGHVVKATGDGMMAVFGGAADAAAAALAGQLALTAEPWGVTGPLQVRMGVHAGQAEQRAGDYFGPTVNRTARLMAAGHGGQVLLSASAAALAAEQLPARASLLDLGEHRLKDLGRPERVFQLVRPDLPANFPPLAAARPGSTGLPARAAELVGREAELAEIGGLLADASVRLLTLTGPGGTGKTILAIRAAEIVAPGFADGVSFVDLSASRDTNAVLVALARAVGLGEVIDRPLREALTDWLRERRMLVVLDNLEQVTEAAGVVAELLRDCPRLTLLATSREALHVRAERVFPVPPLGLPPAGPGRPTARQVEGFEAVRLFVDRARAVRPDFHLTDENAAAVAEICRRLDGLPLAIELAAARLRLFSPDVLRDRLGDRLRLLRSGPRDLPERQQTLRATMDWSYELLGAREQRLFELLAVFAGAEIAAVEAVATDVAADVADDDGLDLDVLDGLASLADKSLLRRVDVPGGEPRMAMLETIREFAADRLAQRPDVSARVCRAHAAYYAEMAHRLRADLTGNEREAALATLAADVANLRTAWAFWVAAGDLEQLDRLADSLLILNDARGWYLDTVGLTSDMLAVLEASEASPDRVGREIALRISLARALMATRGFTREVEDAFAGALDLFERGGDVRQQHSVLRGLASLYQFRGQFDRAAALGRQILELGERQGDRRIQADGHFLVGTTMAFVDDLQGGLEHLDRAISLFGTGPGRARTARPGNDPRVSSLTTSAFTLWLMGCPDRAAERASAAIALADELEHPFTAAYARFHAGLLHLWRREPEVVRDRAVGLLEIADEHDFRIWSAAGGCLLGAAQVGLGRVEEGLAGIRAGTALYQDLRSPPVFWPLLLVLEAGACLGAGQPAAGLPAIDAAIEIMGQGGGSTLLPELHLLKGDLLAALPAEVATAAVVRGASAGGAEHCYRVAHDRAAALGARMSHLRAATRLARLRVADGDDAAEMRALATVHATFTEGFATADLLQARDLLAAAEPG